MELATKRRMKAVPSDHMGTDGAEPSMHDELVPELAS
jgi:hypothetical protein